MSSEHRSADLQPFVSTIAAVISTGLIGLWSFAAVAGVGRTAGSFQVSAGGAATYTVPLWSPPGIGALQPQVALAYNSAAGDGLLGQGWSLAAGSTISRCAQTWAQDGSAGPITLTSGSAGDRYCLDGNRLRIDNSAATGSATAYGLAGAVYRTELDTFAKVTQNGGSATTEPDWFEVRTKDGLIYEYGRTNNTSNSKFYAGGSSANPTTTWAVNKISDRNGNSIQFTYENNATSPDAYRLQKIDYPYTASGGPYYQIKFNYEARRISDSVLASFFAGFAVQEKNRLKDVSVYYAVTNQLLRQYQLSYEPGTTTTGRERINQIKECASASDCLSPTTITYQDGAKDWSSTATDTGRTVSQLANAFSLDLNGDGRIDLIYPAGAYFWVLWGTGADFGVPVNTWIDSTNYANALPLDYFGNGKPGLLIPYGSNWRFIYYDTGTAVFDHNDNVAEGGGALAVPSDGAANAWIVDINGDGREDLVYTSDLGQWSLSRINGRLNTGAGFSNTQYLIWEPSGYDDLVNACETISASSGNPRAFGSISSRNRAQIHFADFNGDGKPDIFLQISRVSPGNCLNGDGPSPGSIWHDRWRVLVSHAGSGFDKGSMFSPAAVPPDPLIGDFNGDGLADVIGADSGTSNNWHIAYGRGGGTLNFEDTGVAIGDTSKALFVDWDGDGRTDILYYLNNAYYVARWTATGFATTGVPLSSIGSGTTSPIIADVNADGLPDVIYANASNHVVYRLHNGVAPDLLTSITDGHLINASPTYVSIASNGQQTYTSGNAATFPEQDVAGPAAVVSSVSASDGTGGTYTQTYTYSGARVDVQGRGYEGFATRKMVDSRDNLVHYEQYFQQFPYTGMVSQMDLRQSNGTDVIESTVNTKDVLSTGTSPDTRSYPYFKKIVTQKNEFGGARNTALIAEQTTDITLDAISGTPTDTKVTLVEKDSASGHAGDTYITDTNSVPSGYPLLNDTVNWCIGRPARQTITRTVPGAPTQTRTVAYTMDDGANAAKCRVKVQTIEPGDSALEVATTYGFGTCGQVTSVSVVGKEPNASGGWVAMTPRVSSATFTGTTCQFPNTTTNADGTSTNDYYWDKGLLKTVTDPNDIVVKSLAYDAYGRVQQDNHPDGTKTTYTWADCLGGVCWIANDLAASVAVAFLNSSGGAIRTETTFLDGLERPRFVMKNSMDGPPTTSETTYLARGPIDKQYAPSFNGSRQAGYRQFTWDLLNRQSTETVYPPAGGGNAFGKSYAYKGLQFDITDGNSNVWTRWGDVEGKLRKLIDPVAVSGNPGNTVYAYDAFNNLTSVVDAVGVTTNWGYNLRGFLTSTSDLDRGPWTYVPNSLGEPASVTNANNQQVKMTYDTMGRLIQRIDPGTAYTTEGTSNWTYGTSKPDHEKGRLIQVTGVGGYSKILSYDGVGRLSGTSTAMPAPDSGTYTVGYSYSTSTGLPETLTYPASTGATPLKIKYGYSNFGFLNKVSDFYDPNKVFWQADASDALGNPIDETLGTSPTTPVKISSVYDPLRGLLTSRTAGTDGARTNRQNLSFTWDAEGNLATRKSTAIDGQHTTGEQEFFYDHMNRYSYSKFNNGSARTYEVTLDQVGRISATNEATVSSASYTYVSSAHPHAPLFITSGSGCSAVTQPFAYDANGNMTQDGTKKILWYSYDLPYLVNSNLSTTPSTVYSSVFYYTPDRQRWLQSAYNGYSLFYTGQPEITVYVEGVMEKFTSGAGSARVTAYRHYIPVGPSARVVYTRKTDNSPATTYYMVTDHLGSPSALLDGSGALLATEAFDEYGYRSGINWQGNPSTNDMTAIYSTTPQGFTGHENLDNLGVIHMNGRIFDARINLFMSADPYVDGADSSQAYNRYSYLANRPLSGMDPSGFAGLVTPNLKKLEGGISWWEWDSGTGSGSGGGGGSWDGGIPPCPGIWCGTTHPDPPEVPFWFFGDGGTNFMVDRGDGGGGKRTSDKEEKEDTEKKWCINDRTINTISTAAGGAAGAATAAALTGNAAAVIPAAIGGGLVGGVAGYLGSPGLTGAATAGVSIGSYAMGYTSGMGAISTAATGFAVPYASNGTSVLVASAGGAVRGASAIGTFGASTPVGLLAVNGLSRFGTGALVGFEVKTAVALILHQINRSRGCEK